VRSLSDCRLYTFVDTAYLAGRPPADLARALCDGGADLVQLRAEGWRTEEVRRLAETILPVCEAAGTWFVVNDHPEVAGAVGAPLCHLGQEDFFDHGRLQSTEVCPRDGGVQLGLSTHSPEQARRAVGVGPAYVAIGPVYSTPTKPGRPPVTLDYVRWASRHLEIPWFAIGGIHLGNVDEVVAAGAERICVVSAILQASDVARACLAFRERLPSA